MTKFHWFQITAFVLAWLFLNLQARVFKQFRPVATIFFALSFALLLSESYFPSRMAFVLTTALLLFCVCYRNPLKSSHPDVET